MFHFDSIWFVELVRAATVFFLAETQEGFDNFIKKVFWEKT